MFNGTIYKTEPRLLKSYMELQLTSSVFTEVDMVVIEVTKSRPLINF